LKQVLISQGRAIVEETPEPVVEPGTVLVRVNHSCISVGTEMSGVKATSEPLWKRALKNPGKVKKVLDMALKQGISQTRDTVKGKMTSGIPAGYSAAGRVIETGEGIDDTVPGDRVACAGAQCAHHAEVIRVPRNLMARVPEGVDFAAASTVTLGAIALQGVRRGQPTMGETFVVLGLGIIGQITAQLLKANGCRVIGTDLDRGRINTAIECGMDAGVHPDGGDTVETVARITGGTGADGVIITAATPSDEVVSTAFGMCRKKGRVVLVGDVGLNLDRADFYAKELDFFISTSYGPGRYDDNYEEKGLDYPIAYVRWTENRNMQEYLRLLAEGKVDVSPLVSETYPVDEAGAAYESIKSGGTKPLMVLLSYPEGREEKRVRQISNPYVRASADSRPGIAMIGAGGFAREVHLPNMMKLAGSMRLQTIVCRTGHSASAMAKQFSAANAATDFRIVLEDPAVDAVMICTRHNTHADIALEALEAGKHVFVEKPLALTREELDRISSFYSSGEGESGLPLLMTGFNRRFSPFARRISEMLENRREPVIINYRMNAGYIPPDHWVQTEEGGGRNLGEACHIYDLFTYFTGSRHQNVQAAGIDSSTGFYRKTDNFSVSIRFEDGSLANLTYTAMGSKEFPKERMEIFSEGRVFYLDDYRTLQVAGARGGDLEKNTIEKGHPEELEAFARVITEGGDWPIPLWQMIQASEIALQTEEILHR